MGLGLRKTSALKPSSVLLITPHDGSTPTQRDLVACVHCGQQHDVAAALRDHASGRRTFGFCPKCGGGGITCPGGCPDGSSDCVPQEQRLENMEAGRHPLAPRPAHSFIATTGQLPLATRRPPAGKIVTNV